MGPTTKPNLKNLDLLAAIAIDTKSTDWFNQSLCSDRENDDLNFHQLGDACLLRTPNL